MHRDIKLDNLIMAQPFNLSSIKIIDFGLSQVIDEEEYCCQSCGSTGFLAPEVITDKVYDGRCDVFSVGVIFYMLLTGDAPIFGGNFEDILELTKECDIDFQKEQLLEQSDACLELLQLMLKKNPKERLTSKQCLKHEYFIKFRNYKKKSEELIDCKRRSKMNKQC